jgi:hypothetical protein
LGLLAMFLAADFPMAHAITLPLRSTDTKLACGSLKRLSHQRSKGEAPPARGRTEMIAQRHGRATDGHEV